MSDDDDTVGDDANTHTTERVHDMQRIARSGKLLKGRRADREPEAEPEGEDSTNIEVKPGEWESRIAVLVAKIA